MEFDIASTFTGVIIVVIGGLALVIILWFYRTYPHRLGLHVISKIRQRCWERREGQEQRRIREEQCLNEWVKLTTDEFVHRGCAGSDDQIVEIGPNSQYIAVGRCARCGIHGGSPRRKNE